MILFFFKQNATYEMRISDWRSYVCASDLAGRPLPAGLMDRQSALHFGVGLSFFTVLLLGLATNWLAAGILAVSILFYVLVYTVWLKRRTPQNIVIGGA